MKRIAVIGARGHVGTELLALLGRHDGFELAMVNSRQLAGERVSAHFAHRSDLVIEDGRPEVVAQREIDAWILGLPNDLSSPWVAAIDEDAPESVIVDLSADHRFNDRWTYGLTEARRAEIRGARRISNPGCYATGIQVALLPILDLLRGRPAVFGVSGYSGAGTTPSDRNDPTVLAGNVLPYSLTGHTHEREVGRHLGHDVDFMPHVASFFRGITLTINVDIGAASFDELNARYAMWADEPLIRYTAAAPRVSDNVGEHFVAVGGLCVDPSRGRAVVVATLDNLLKGAATQALQNLNLACGFSELSGIPMG